MNADEFYLEARRADFPDEMVFQIAAKNPANKGTFSREAINDTVDLFDSFVMARIFGQWTRTGKPPKEIKLHVKIEWELDNEIALETGPPWFSGEVDDMGLTQIDGERRIPRKP